MHTTTLFFVLSPFFMYLYLPNMFKSFLSARFSKAEALGKTPYSREKNYTSDKSSNQYILQQSESLQKSVKME